MSRLPLLVYYGMGGVLARIALIRVGNGADAGVVDARAVVGRLFEHRPGFGFLARARIRHDGPFQAENRRAANFLKIVLASDR